MSEKKSRVSRYQKLHVDANEFKKQQVVNEEGIKRLQRFQNLDLNDEKGIVDVNKSASTKNEMQMMESFANNVVRSRVQKSKVFVIEENTLEEPIQPIIEEVEKPVIKEVVSLDDIMTESILDSTCEEISTDLFEPVFIEEELINEVIKKTGEDTTMLEDLKETLAVEEMQEIVIEEVEEDYIIDEIIEEDYVEVEVIDKDDIVVVETVETVEYTEKEEIKSSKRRKKTRKERWHNFGMGFFTFCNVCALICFFVVYGPFHQVRDAFVTTAMSSMTKKFLANVLYSNATIQDVLATNITIEPNEVMDSNAISIGNLQAPEVYSSVYEEQILKRGEGEDLYKIVRLDEDGYEGYAVFVYDPTKIGIATTKNLGSAYGEFVTTIAKRANAEVAINGGGFASSGTPAGYVYKEGKVIWSRNRESKWGGGTIGFTKEGVMILTKSKGQKALDEGVYNGVDFGPFLIVNGKSANISGNGGWGIHPRTVIGQRKDGIVVILIIDGRSRTSTGISLSTAIEIMERYNVYNAANLDGGSSTTLVVNGKVHNNPCSTTDSGQRYLPVALVIKE